MKQLPVLNSLRTDDERRLHPYCQECKQQTEAAGKVWSETIQNCHGIYSELDFQEIADHTQGTEVQLTIDEVREILDPSYWIFENLQLRPHWYQDRYLRCTSIRRALRWGRRTGKTHILAAEQIQKCLTTAGLKITVAIGRAHV